jgi:hypothetical protein
LPRIGKTCPSPPPQVEGAALLILEIISWVSAIKMGRFGANRSQQDTCFLHSSFVRFGFLTDLMDVVRPFTLNV